MLLGASGGLFLALDHPGGATGSDATAGAPTAAPGTGSADAQAPTTMPTTTPTTIAPSSRRTTGPTTTTTVPAAPTCSGPTSTLEGSTVSTRYGPVQVEATIDASGAMCSVDAPVTPTGGKSQSINARAVPILDQRALAAGGTDFAAVTGATITSAAYKQSLQSILDRR